MAGYVSKHTGKTIDAAVDAYLTGGAGGTVDVDKTLTKAGAAADAKATGTKIAALTEEKADKTFSNVDDGAIPFDKLASVSATEISGSGSAASPNIVNTETVTLGLIVANGAVEGASSAYYTELIPVEPGQTLRIFNWRQLGTTASSYPGAEYDADGNFTARLATWKFKEEDVVVDGVAAKAYSHTLGTSTKYIRLNIDGVALSTVMATLDEPIPSTYMPYSEGSEAWTKEVYDVNPDEVRVKRSVNIPWGGFLNISYSNLWSYGPINTEMAYETAGFFGFDAIKGDVQISADNVLIMCHDAGYTLDENGKITTYSASNSTAIRTMQSADILALEHAMNDLGAHPCTIDDYLRICAKWGKIAFVTIRDADIDVIAPILLAALKRWNLQHKSIINSFTLASLKIVRNLDRYVWVNQVMERNITDTDYDNAVSLYPCALSPYGSMSGNAETMLAVYEQMATVVEKCKANGIPVLTAGGYTREQVDFYRAHFNGAQIHQITDCIPRRRYIITLNRVDGAWNFVRKFTFEHSGTITDNGSSVDITCKDILSTWLRYLYPSVKAVCTNDSSVTVTASIAHDGTYIRFTPSSIADGQQIMITLDF